MNEEEIKIVDGGVGMNNKEEIDKLFKEGEEYFNNAEYENTIECYSKILNIEPNLYFIYNNRGYTYFQIKKYKKSLKDFRKSINIQPNENAYLNIGIVYGDLGEYKKSLHYFNIIIKRDFFNSSARYNRSILFIKRKNYLQAIIDCSIVIDNIHNHAHAYYNRASAYHSLAMYEEALRDYRKIIDIDKNYFLAYNGIGLIYIELKEYEKAISYFDEAIELESNNSSAYYNKSIVYHKEAINSFNESKKLNRNESSNNISSAYYSIEKYYESINSIKELIKNCPHILHKVYFFLVDISKNVKQEDVEEVLKAIINKQDNAKIDRNSLYSYVAFDKNAIDSIMHQYKYASEIFNFNDPTDPVIRLIKDYENTKELFKKVRIACLSTDPLNMLMYSHYTDRHKGICIEYDFSNFNNDDTALVKVAYEKKLNIDYNIYELTILGMNKLSKDTSFLDLFATKHKSWKYESEYRIISFNQDKIKLPIKSIYLGKNMPTSEKNLVMSIAKNVDKKIKIYEVSSNDKNLFALKEKEINIVDEV